MKKPIAIFVCCALFFAGCEEYVPVEEPVLSDLQRDYVLCFVLDTSGSFLPKMFGANGRGYKFFMKACEKYFQSRMGDHDRILISQLSANKRTLLWEGTPITLRKRFGSSASLQQFIEVNSDPSGSRVHAALADTFDYINGLPGVKQGSTKVCVIVLSDMDDTTNEPDDRLRMIDAFGRFAKTNGTIGLYWVDQFCIKDCRQCLTDAGLKDFVVESDIVEDPKLPFSEQ